MRVSGSLAAVRRVVTVDWKNYTGEQAKRHLINTARQGIAGILNVQTVEVGARPGVTVYANTPGNTNLESVVLPGPIVALFDHRAAIVKTGLELLRAASPRRSGRYVASHTVLLNGSEIAQVPANIRATDVLTLVNPVPYARRLEIGKTESGRDFVIQVPNRIYERTAKRLRSTFGNVADISFGYVELTGAYAVKGKLGASYGLKGGGRRKRRQRAGSAIQAPAIFIRPLGVRPV